MQQEQILNMFGKSLRQILRQCRFRAEEVYEIRLRIGCPMAVICQGKEYLLTEQGAATKDPGDAYKVHAADLKETLEYIAGYSIYAFEEELRQGFITVQGGHRVGIAGHVIVEDQKVKTIRNISCMNVRISHEMKGCATELLPYLIKQGIFFHTLIISAPCCGKTTLLRDLVRQLSNGTRYLKGMNVGVVDERSEIGGCYQGVPQNDVGMRTDILDGCPKGQGMMMLIRSMAPGIIAVDELGDEGDFKAIEAVLHCGCKLLATVHGTSMEDIRKKPLLQKLMERGVFGRYIVLQAKKHPGQLQGIYDGQGNLVYGGSYY